MIKLDITFSPQPARTDHYQSLSQPVSAWRTTSATVVKGLQIARRYLPNLAGGLVELMIRMAFFLIMANAVAFTGQGSFGQALTGHNLFIFFQGSLLLFVFTRSTLWGPINAVSNDLYNGTLEYLYSTPCSRYAYYVGSVLTEVITSLVVFLPLYIFLVVSSHANLQNMLLVLLACGVVLTALTAMGIMVALLALVWRQVGSIAGVLGILFEMLAGAYLPITAFPRFLQYLAYFLPYTWGYDLIRYYSFRGAGTTSPWKSILPVPLEWAILLTFAILYTLLSRYLLGRAEQLAKRSGLHII